MGRRRDIGDYVVALERDRKKLREYERIVDRILIAEYGIGRAEIREKLADYEILKIAKVLFDGCGASTDEKRQELVMQLLADRKKKAAAVPTPAPPKPTIAAGDSGVKPSDQRELFPRKGAAPP